jgi:hypothetical protein
MEERKYVRERQQEWEEKVRGEKEERSLQTLLFYGNFFFCAQQTKNSNLNFSDSTQRPNSPSPDHTDDSLEAGPSKI